MYMPEEIYKQFEKRKAEALKQPDVRELSPEKEKEMLRQTVSERIAQPSSQPVATQSVQQVQSQPKERQIKLLTDLAFEKGIPHAVEVVKKMDNPYLLDEFHDALVDELYKKLIETGKLKAL